MIISCPRCGTRYRIDVAQIGEEGRDVRCSHCTKVWFATPRPDPDELGVTEPEAAVSPPLEEPPVERSAAGFELRKQTRVLASWLFLVILVLAIAGFIVGRHEIATALPQTAALYQRIGLPLTFDTKLEFRRLSSAQNVVDEVPMLIVEGEIFNVSGEATLLPPLRLDLLTEELEVVASETYDLDIERLAPGSTREFEIRFEKPPEEAQSFRLTFPSADDQLN